MTKRTKIWLITAAVLILTGCIVFGGVMMALDWDFSRLNTTEYETNAHQVQEAFTAITVDTKMADVHIVPAEDGACRVVCYEQAEVKHTVSVENGVLVIRAVDARKWYVHIGINFSSPKITVYLPEKDYSALSVRTNTGDVNVPEDFRFENMDISVNTGDIRNGASVSATAKLAVTTGNIYLEGISAESIEMSVTTGKTTLVDVQCTSLLSKGKTGDLFLTNVIATGCLTLERTTGDIELDRCDAGQLHIQTQTGDIKGSLLTEKVFSTQTETGRVNVPQTVTGGICTLITTTGNIKIALA